MFDRGNIMRNVEGLNDEIRAEKEKPSEERDKEKLLKLYQKQLMEGIKLNTGSVIF